MYHISKLVYAKHSRKVDPSKGYKGITCFIATRDMGIKIAKKEQKLGIRASSTCSLDFDDLKIPAENIIGGEGKGYKVWINHFRIYIALNSASLFSRLPLKSSTRVKFQLLCHPVCDLTPSF